MSEDWKLPSAARWWLGIGAPIALWLVAGLTIDWYAGARVAGGLSVFVLAVTTVLLTVQGTSRLDRVSKILELVSKILVLVAAPLGVFLWGTGRPLLVVVAITVSLLVCGLMLLFRRDLLAVASIMLGWMVSGVVLFFAFLGDWPDAALWGGGLTLAVVAVYFVGRLFQKCGWRQEAPFALYLAATPVGLMLWGVGEDYKMACLLGFVVGMAGFWVKFFNKDWTSEKP